MHTNARRGPLSIHLDRIELKSKDGDLSLKDIFQIMGKESHYAIIAFLILPFLQPIPLFGLSTPFGMLIAMLAVFAYFNRPPWLPERWANRKVSAKTVGMITEGSERIFKKMSVILHRRWKFLFQGPFKALNAFLLCANAILLALPLPIPFSNAIPAWMILFQTLAHLEEDGLFIIFSYLQTIVAIVYFVMIYKGAGLGLEAIGLGG